ncbi:collagen alpha-1(I) chain-like [Ammospiza nelsoni]|uniref:collagen alpha-1(I) chain-like n=1 Tax=Ammospiza nelsoni TaxID=2857394 RepID=UPI00286CD382|nr:collagen alpha-1(I) chain-like [Ammospiza nelsoni]
MSVQTRGRRMDKLQMRPSICSRPCLGEDSAGATPGAHSHADLRSAAAIYFFFFSFGAQKHGEQIWGFFPKPGVPLLTAPDVAIGQADTAQQREGQEPVTARRPRGHTGPRHTPRPREPGTPPLPQVRRAPRAAGLSGCSDLLAPAIGQATLPGPGAASRAPKPPTLFPWAGQGCGSRRESSLGAAWRIPGFPRLSCAPWQADSSLEGKKEGRKGAGRNRGAAAEQRSALPARDVPEFPNSFAGAVPAAGQEPPGPPGSGMRELREPWEPTGSAGPGHCRSSGLKKGRGKNEVGGVGGRKDGEEKAAAKLALSVCASVCERIPTEERLSADLAGRRGLGPGPAHSPGSFGVARNGPFVSSLHGKPRPGPPSRFPPCLPSPRPRPEAAPEGVGAREEGEVYVLGESLAASCEQSPHLWGEWGAPAAPHLPRGELGVSHSLPDPSFPTEREWGHRPLLSPELLPSSLSPVLSRSLSDRTEGPKPERSPSASGRPPGRKHTHPWGSGEAPRKSRGPAAGCGYRVVYLPQRCQRGKRQCLPPLKSLTVSLSPQQLPALRTRCPGCAQPSQPPPALCRVHTSLSHTCPSSAAAALHDPASPGGRTDGRTDGHPSPAPARANLEASAHTRASPAAVRGFLPFQNPFSHTCISQHPSTLTCICPPPSLQAHLLTRSQTDRQTDTPPDRRPPRPRHPVPLAHPPAGAVEGHNENGTEVKRLASAAETAFPSSPDAHLSPSFGCSSSGHLSVPSRTGRARQRLGETGAEKGSHLWPLAAPCTAALAALLGRSAVPRCSGQRGRRCPGLGAAPPGTGGLLARPPCNKSRRRAAGAQPAVSLREPPALLPPDSRSLPGHDGGPAALREGWRLGPARPGPAHTPADAAGCQHNRCPVRGKGKGRGEPQAGSTSAQENAKETGS